MILRALTWWAIARGVWRARRPPATISSVHEILKEAWCGPELLAQLYDEVPLFNGLDLVSGQVHDIAEDASPYWRSSVIRRDDPPRR